MNATPSSVRRNAPIDLFKFYSVLRVSNPSSVFLTFTRPHFKPLFPKSVQERLKFKTAPVLKSLKELTPLTTQPTTKKSFIAEVKKLLDA